MPDDSHRPVRSEAKHRSYGLLLSFGAVPLPAVSPEAVPPPQYAAQRTSDPINKSSFFRYRPHHTTSPSPCQSKCTKNAGGGASTLLGAPTEASPLFGAPTEASPLFGAPAEASPLFGAPARRWFLCGSHAAQRVRRGAFVRRILVFCYVVGGSCQALRLLRSISFSSPLTSLGAFTHTMRTFIIPPPLTI